MSIWTWINHHRALSIGLSAIVIVVTAAVVAYITLFRTTSTPLNLRQAIRLYRDRQPSAGVRRVAGLPKTGVYDYDTTGHEALSILGASRSFPSRTPMIVSGNQCLSVRWEPVVQHVEAFTECRGAARSVFVQSTTSYERIAGTNTRTVITCPADTYLRPPDIAVDDRWSSICRSGSMVVDTKGVVLGRSKIDIGGTELPAWHTRLTFYFNGAETGSSPTDYWLSTSDNLILRQHETVTVNQEVGPLGAVHYSEDMTASLQSLQPYA